MSSLTMRQIVAVLVIVLATSSAAAQHKTAKDYTQLADVLNNRGDYEKGDYDKAISLYDKAIDLDPKYVKAFVGRVDAWHRQRIHNRAISDYNEAIRLDPTVAIAYVQRGRIWNRIGKYDKAVANFEKGIRLDQTNPDAYLHFARFRAMCPNKKHRNNKKAVEYATRACELTMQKNAGCLSTLAIAHAASGDFKQATKLQMKAMELADEKEMKYHYRQQLWYFLNSKTFWDTDEK